MKTHLLSLVACLLPAFLWGKGEVVYTRPGSLYSNAGLLTINKVVLSDTATIVDFTASGQINSWFSMATTTCLSDEEAVTYPLKGASGLTPGKKCYIPKSGSMTFQLRFAPLPKDTRIFDLVEGAGQDLFRIYGIHDTRTKVEIPVAQETVDTEETDESLFRKGKAWVRGRIEDYSRRPDNGLLFFNFCTFGQTLIEPYALTRQCTAIRPDGTFCAELSVDHPVWADISIHQETLPFYVRPGDTLDITMRTIDGRLCADYASSHPKGCYDRLLKH